MSAISTYLEYIRSKIYAKDVRTAIVNAISQCYDDVNKPALQTEAMQAAVQAKIDAGQMAALTIADGSLTGAKLANGTIPTAKIADGAITAVKLASGAVATDTTLTHPGIPADAKAVGDAIDVIQDDLSQVEGNVNGIITGDFFTINYKDGDTAGYYRKKSGTTNEVELKDSSVYKNRRIAITDSMESVVFEFLSVTGFDSASIFCGFLDAEEKLISKSPIESGNFDIEIPANATYILLNYFGNTYNPDGYTIKLSSFASKKDLAEQTEDIRNDISGIQNRIDGYEESLTDGTENGYYRLDNGVITPKTSTTFKRSKIDVEEWMESVSYTINSVSGINLSTVFCGFTDQNDTYISMGAAAVGEHNLRIPTSARYIYLGFFGDTYNSAYTIKSSKFATTSDIDDLGISNPFEGLSGVAFGTSLTYRAQTTGGFLQYLPDLSGITFDNQGVGSSYILGDGGALDMLAKIKSYTSYGDKQICTLEGFVNDWYGNKALGEYTDVGETTVCGCVRSALNYMMSQNQNLTIFLILDHYGRNYNSIDCSSLAKNGSNLTQYAYYSEIAKVAESLGVPVIRGYAESQISQNTPQYYLDNIHLNGLGARQSAYFIWGRMKNYYPNAI